jgi:ABC-type lipopolysaccharide export system ATPase subunit
MQSSSPVGACKIVSLIFLIYGIVQDVIALRKRSGTITGDVLLNGWPQDPVSFRRCSGYVEQFDVQTPQLTVKETIMFSAKLRLDSHDMGEMRVETFVDKIMEDVELSDVASALVGTDETGGLSFEQKKRLSIAVELAASPSIIFLDEVSVLVFPPFLLAFFFFLTNISFPCTANEVGFQVHTLCLFPSCISRPVLTFFLSFFSVVWMLGVRCS